MLVAENEAVKKIFGNKPARFSISAKDLEELVTTVLQNCLLLRSKLEDESKNVASLKRGLSTEECVRKRKIQGEEDTAEDALQKVHSRKKSFESLVGWFNPYLTDLVQRLMKDIHQNPKTE